DDDLIGTVGRPLSHNRIEISEESEILVHTERPLCKGYFESDPAEAAATFVSPTCIATGDIGALHDGRLYLNGRKEDILVTARGFRFHPLEIEQRVLMCPEVRQAAVLLDDNGSDIAAVISVDDAADAPTVDAVTRSLASVNSALDVHKRISKAIFTSER